MTAFFLRTTLACVLLTAPAWADNGATTTARANGYHVILCGSSGEAEYAPKFRDWGTRLKTVLAAHLGAAPERH